MATVGAESTRDDAPMASTRASSTLPRSPVVDRGVTRWLSRPAFWIAALALLFGFPLTASLLRRVPPAPPDLGALPAFSLVSQDGEPFGSAELAGRVWVANFIFTTCPTMCPLLTAKMKTIGQRARRLGPDLHLVSFSVDPERDTPERLRSYAREHGADPHKWTFLTGKLDQIETAVVGGFKIAIERPAKPAAQPTAEDPTLWQIVHGEHFVLVDRQLHIRGYFSADAEGLDRLMDALGRVASETPPS